MKCLSKKLCIIVVTFLFAGNVLNAQKSLYIGPGLGLDYGGIIGGKVEFLPVKQLGFFGGVGYNLLNVGWNVGATWKILPDKKVSPNPMIFYGYNGVFVGSDSYSKQYNMTSYGVSIGMNLDIKFGDKSKLSVGLFCPFRSGKFMDNIDNAKNDSNINTTDLWPIAFSIGYNIKMF